MMRLTKFIAVILTSFSTLLAADCCIPYACELGLGYDYFRSLPEGDWEGNTGALAEFNLSVPAPYLMDYGIGVQFGGSYGTYDWTGRASAFYGKQTKSQQQLFLTGAIFWRTPCESGVNMGLAYDWMWNKNAGVFALQCDIAQLRFQGGYLCNQTNEWGLWGTLDVHTSHRRSGGFPVSFRAVSQVNLYWEHIFENCSRTAVWAGIPYKKSLMYSTGRAGRFIIGGSFHTPLNDSLSLDGHACYMWGHNAFGARKQRNYAANLCIELKWAFCNQECGPLTYMLIGNNSNFITDTSVTF